MENNKQQTAVEQFLNAIKDQILLSKEHLEMIESYADQCKEIEKEKLEDAWVEGFKNWNPSKTFEQYYEQTYKGGEQ